MMWMWPNARISVMGGEQAAGVLTQVKQDGLARKGLSMSDAEVSEFKKPIIEQYEKQGHPYYASARLWTMALSTLRIRAQYLVLP